MEYFAKVSSFFINLLIPEESKISRLLQLDRINLARKLGRPRPIESEDAHAIFDYRNTSVRLLVKAMKSRANRSVIKSFASFMAEEMVEIAGEAGLFEGIEKIILIPMPSSEKRRKEKGWNQCELLCNEILKLCNYNIGMSYDVLKKVRDTEKQAFLERAERLENVRGSMQANFENQKSEIVNLNSTLFVVIDDVYTTGATYREARRALKASGAKHIKGIFVAH